MTTDNVVELKEKLVSCPACQGKGYTIGGDPDVEGPSVDQCELCDSQGKVAQHLAEDWPYK
jgi:DnaJ-class molecular chaperone